MKTFECYFTGRKVGAIGAFCEFIVTVEAENEDAARLKLYDTHEHISKLMIRDIPPGLAPRLPRNPETLWGFEKNSL